MNTSQPRAVLLDRDGVLNVDLATSVRSAEQLTLIPESAEAIALMKHLGYLVIVITNQACVGRGELSSAELDRIHRRLVAQVKLAGGDIDAIYVCTHTPSADCTCRKPRPGLLLSAQRDYGLHLSRTWFVGDDHRDLQAALNAEALPVLVRTGKGKRVTPPPGTPVFSNLMRFAESLG
jgi:D-glycero-D-manno-heptose 1,7-bisphosphate phosphatase